MKNIILIKIFNKIFNENHVISDNSSDEITVNQKIIFFIKKHDYCKENHFCFKCNYSNHSVKNCKFSFNSNQMFVKNDKIKSQFSRMWSKKHIRIQILHINNFNNNDKTDHNVYIIIDDLKSDFDRLCKCLKN